MWNSFVDLLANVMSVFSGIPGFNTGLVILFLRYLSGSHCFFDN